MGAQTFSSFGVSATFGATSGVRGAGGSSFAAPPGEPAHAVTAKHVTQVQATSNAADTFIA
jgi:hypothetical protein